MLIRFRADVIDLKPKIVVILAGTNDIAGNTGPTTVKMITDNIISMAELARSDRIHVILSSILPAADYPWNPGFNPPEKITAVNYILKKYTERNGITYLDYYSSMVTSNKGLKKKYTYDGVHPNRSGYKLMSGLADKAISETLDLIGKSE
jgi:lysophospholipase L1-like esterase